MKAKGGGLISNLWKKISATVMRTQSGVQKIELKDDSQYFEVVGNDFAMRNKKVGGGIKVDGKVHLGFQVNAVDKLTIGANNINHDVDAYMETGHKLWFVETLGVKKGHILQDADYTKFYDQANNACITYGDGSIYLRNVNPDGADNFTLGVDGNEWKEAHIHAMYNAYHAPGDNDYTITDTDYFVEWETNLTGDKTGTLPSALIALEGWRIRIRLSANNGHNLTIVTEGAETIDGNPNYVFVGADGIIELISDGTNMRILSEA